MIMTIQTRLTHRSLMAKSKDELATMVLDRCDAEELVSKENEALRKSIQNQTGDNLCWITGGVPQIPPRAEFLESCARYHAQISGERGELSSGRTIAQLEAECARLEELRKASIAAFNACGDLLIRILTEHRAEMERVQNPERSKK